MLSNPEIRAIIFYIILCCKGGHQSFLAAGKRRFLFFFISIPVMYRIDNVSSEKILIQFINLFTDWGTWLQILHFAESWLGWSFGMVRWPLHHYNLTDTCPLDRSYQANSSNSCLWMPSFSVTVMTLLEKCWYNLSILNKQKVYQ